MMNGTPSHLSFLIYATIAQKVGHLESCGTVSSSLYAGLVPSRDLPYWPMMTFLGSMAGILAEAPNFLLRMSAVEEEIGGCHPRRARVWGLRVFVALGVIPDSPQLPPRASVPNRSVN